MAAAAPTPQEVRSKAIGRIAVAVIATWVALVAIPGAVPWLATDDLPRALAIGVAVGTAIALSCLLLAIFLSDDKVVQPAVIGTSAAVIAIVLAGLEVMDLMLLKNVDKAYQEMATAIGLLALLVIASGIAGGLGGFFEGFKFSTLSLAGTVAAAALVVVYLVLVQSLFGRTSPNTLDPEWIRLTTLLNGLQALAFAAAGALLGTAVQGQATAEAKSDGNKADDAAAELNRTVQDLSVKAKNGLLVELKSTDSLTNALDVSLGNQAIQNPDTRAAEATRLQNEVRVPQENLAARLENSLERARLLRRR